VLFVGKVERLATFYSRGTVLFVGTMEGLCCLLVQYKDCEIFCYGRWTLIFVFTLEGLICFWHNTGTVLFPVTKVGL
jgi:hypothetical protein